MNPIDDNTDRDIHPAQVAAHSLRSWPSRLRIAAALPVLEEPANAQLQHRADRRHQPHRVELFDPGVLTGLSSTGPWGPFIASDRRTRHVLAVHRSDAG